MIMRVFLQNLTLTATCFEGRAGGLFKISILVWEHPMYSTFIGINTRVKSVEEFLSELRR